MSCVCCGVENSLASLCNWYIRLASVEEQEPHSFQVVKLIGIGQWRPASTVHNIDTWIMHGIRPRRWREAVRRSDFAGPARS